MAKTTKYKICDHEIIETEKQYKMRTTMIIISWELYNKENWLNLLRIRNFVTFERESTESKIKTVNNEIFK